MTVRLRPMTAAELASWIDASEAAYAEDRMRTGEPEAVARRTASEQYAGYFPGRRPAPGQQIFVVEDGGGSGSASSGSARTRDARTSPTSPGSSTSRSTAPTAVTATRRVPSSSSRRSWPRRVCASWG